MFLAFLHFACAPIVGGHLENRAFLNTRRLPNGINKTPAVEAARVLGVSPVNPYLHTTSGVDRAMISWPCPVPSFRRDAPRGQLQFPQCFRHAAGSGGAFLICSSCWRG